VADAYLSAGLPLLMLPGKVLSKVSLGPESGHPVPAIQARARLSRLPCSPFAVGLGNQASEDACPSARPPGPGLTFRGLSHVGVRASIHRVLPQTDGADPLLGFSSP